MPWSRAPPRSCSRRAACTRCCSGSCTSPELNWEATSVGGNPDERWSRATKVCHIYCGRRGDQRGPLRSRVWQSQSLSPLSGPSKRRGQALTPADEGACPTAGRESGGLSRRLSDSCDVGQSSDGRRKGVSQGTTCRQNCALVQSARLEAQEHRPARPLPHLDLDASRSSEAR